MTEQRLADQVRYILKNGGFAVVESEEIKGKMADCTASLVSGDDSSTTGTESEVLIETARELEPERGEEGLVEGEGCTEALGPIEFMSKDCEIGPPAYWAYPKSPETSIICK